MYDLPYCGRQHAMELSRRLPKSELQVGIAYLDLVLGKKIFPGSEIEALGISSIQPKISDQELRAVQNRLALAISYQG